MQADRTLREKVVHGTKKNPLVVMRFTTGPGTPYPEHFFVVWHWHAKVEAILVRKGCLSLELNLEEHVLAEGDIGIFNSGELHQIEGQGPDTVHDVLLFDPYILDFSYPDEWQEEKIGPFLDHRLRLASILRPSDPGYEQVYDPLVRLLETGLDQKAGWYIQCKLCLLEWFAALADMGYLLPDREQSGAELRKVERYKTVVSYIEEHYGGPVTLQQMADRVPCDRQYLCRSFKEVAGVTPIQYLIRYRIERASFLLADRSRTILEVAMDCGFENVSYFIRKFKEIKGCTPREYRRYARTALRSSSPVPENG